MELDMSELFGLQEPQREYDSGDEDAVDAPMDYDEEDNNERRDDEAEEVPDPAGPESANKPIKPKRIVKNPQPKLDPTRLMGPRGIGILESTFKDVKFQGHGHEREDLAVLMKKLEHWAHRLFPKLPFDDTIKQIEKLGMKKNVKAQMKKLRIDMYVGITPEDLADDIARVGDPQTAEETEPQKDIFDELLGNINDRPSIFSQSNYQQIDTTHDRPSIFSQSSSEPTKSPTVLTAEQKERLEKNKLLAAERRKERLRQQEIKNKTIVDESNTLSFDELNNSKVLPNINTSETTANKELNSDPFDEIDKSLNTESLIVRNVNKTPSLENATSKNEVKTVELLKNNDLEKDENTGIIIEDGDNICTEDDVMKMLDD